MESLTDFTQPELVWLSSIKLRRGTRKQSNKPERDKAIPIFQRKMKKWDGGGNIAYVR